MSFNDYLALGTLIVSVAQLAFNVVKWLVALKTKKPPQDVNLNSGKNQ